MLRSMVAGGCLSPFLGYSDAILSGKVNLNGIARLTPFSPSDIPNLSFALEADSLGLADGANITTWADPYNGANSATPSGTAPKKQTYNGYPVCRFAGNDKLVTNSFLSSAFNTAFTCVVLMRSTVTSLKVMASNQGTVLYIASGNAKSSAWDTNNLSTAFNSVAQGNSQVVAFRYDGATKTINISKAAGVAVAVTGNMGLTGALTIGDLSSGGFGFNGDLRAIYVFQRAISDGELGKLVDYCNARSSAFDAPGSYLLDGDSLTAGTGATHPYSFYLQALLDGAGANYSYLYNFGVSGQQLSTMEADAATQVDGKVFYPGCVSRDVVVVWGGTNDIFNVDAATVEARLVTYCTNRRAAGSKVVVLTCIARSTFNGSQQTERQDYNTYIRANWTNWADKLCDVAADSRFSDFNDLTYYNADKVHLNDAGYSAIADLVYAQINPW